MSEPFNELGYFYKGLSNDPDPPAFNSTSIQNLINDLDPTIGGTIELPPGTYTITSSVFINKPNCAIRGVDEKSTILQYEFDGVCLDVQSLSCEITDITIKGPDRTDFILSKAIRISGNASAHIKDVTLYGSRIGILNNSASLDTLIEYVKYGQILPKECGTFFQQERKSSSATEPSCIVSNCTATECQESAVIIKHSKSRTVLDTCLFDTPGPGSDVVEIGSTSGQLQGVCVRGCVFQGESLASRAISVESSGLQTINRICITQNRIALTTADHCIKIDTGLLPGAATFITGNTLQGGVLQAIKIDNSHNCIVSKNTCSSVSGIGGVHATTCSNIAIHDNKWHGTSATAPVVKLSAVTQGFVLANQITATSTNNALVVENGCTDVIVSSNVIRSNNAFTIVIDSGTNCNILQNSVFSNNGGVRLFNSTHCSVGRNSVYNPSVAFQLNAGLIVDTSNKVTVAGNVINRDTSTSGKAVHYLNGSGCATYGNVLQGSPSTFCRIDAYDLFAFGGNVVISSFAAFALFGPTLVRVASSGNHMKGGYVISGGGPVVNQAPYGTDELDVNF